MYWLLLPFGFLLTCFTYIKWIAASPPKYPRVVKELEGHAYLKENSWGGQRLTVHRHIKSEDVFWLNSMLNGLDSKIILRFYFDDHRIQAAQWKIRQGIAQRVRT